MPQPIDKNRSNPRLRRSRKSPPVVGGNGSDDPNDPVGSIVAYLLLVRPKPHNTMKGILRPRLRVSLLDSWTDMIAGSSFMAFQFTILFSKARKMFTRIFSLKETAGDKSKSKQLQAPADALAEQLELRCRTPKDKEKTGREEVRTFSQRQSDQSQFSQIQ